MSKHATVNQIVAAMAFLNEHIVRMEGGCAYVPGWSDERVAVEVGIPHGSLVRLRRKEFGAFAHLSKSRKDKKPKEYGPKNSEIMRKIDHAIDLMSDINAKLDDLVRSLS